VIKYERAYAEINLDNFMHNIKSIRKHIGSKTKIMAILKANGYGFGTTELLDVLLECNIDFIGMATFQEAMEIRAKTNVPILILGYTPKACFKHIIENDISQTVYNYQNAKELSSIAQTLDKSVRVHIKINTGMNRLGFNTSEDDYEQIMKIINLPNIIIEGVFTHFHTSDVVDKSITENQLDKFLKFINKFDFKNAIIHSANSAAMLDCRNTHLDMVRCGCVIYGVGASSEVHFDKIGIKEVLSLKATVGNVTTVVAGEGISYNTTFITKKDTKVAAITFGYADGYSRAISNKGRVLINGQYAPIIGNVCMDQFMVDVTHIENVKQGDTVVLVGKYGENKITLEEVALHTDSLEREVTCNISERVPRVYTKEGKVKSIVR
jgi:alanine racemase